VIDTGETARPGPRRVVLDGRLAESAREIAPVGRHLDHPRVEARRTIRQLAW
jgi:hypothetical protein